ncbi:MAG: hypothetical protein CMO98_06560 [Woeseia sp.]|nr:hypothetical protein [Woeseia sp.]|tara:strand:- start:1640 stop:2590 length:951 start_codon:yes stop_codon:yes gene_type:complete
MHINWLINVKQFSEKSTNSGRAPHALMLVGVPGIGKRSAAVWLARKRLELPVDAFPVYPLNAAHHADLHWVRPAEGRKTISIDQIRGLVSELSLTSYEGVAKVAVVEPAEVMTINAANSLLKTLEEPAGDTLIILVVDKHGSLPATIYSRCQHLKLTVPREEEALAWLKEVDSRVEWPSILRAAGGAPLAAIGALEQAVQAETMADEFYAIGSGKFGPLDIAAKWSKYEPDFVLAWLSRQVQQLIANKVAGTDSDAISSGLNSVMNTIDSRNLFCYLDMINRLKNQSPGSFNLQLTLEGLLIDWSQRLESLYVSEG